MGRGVRLLAVGGLCSYKEQGYVPISMKNDFLKIYPDTVTRAENQYVEQESAASADNIIQFKPKTDGSALDDENVRATLSRDGYTLEKSVVLSRHNIRAPLSGEGAA